mmetsp:Transcript_16136/g.36900  ORF Transcript_16136/g.36900 Transcript_16136/m.36900 type:complete len:88 (+) Transcript_16136:1198-1461(+)
MACTPSDMQGRWRLLAKVSVKSGKMWLAHLNPICMPRMNLGKHFLSALNYIKVNWRILLEGQITREIKVKQHIFLSVCLLLRLERGF